MRPRRIDVKPQTAWHFPSALCATYALWGSWWALVPMMIYGVLYASAFDARWQRATRPTRRPDGDRVLPLRTEVIVQASRDMLVHGFGVAADDIAYDEY